MKNILMVNTKKMSNNTDTSSISSKIQIDSLSLDELTKLTVELGEKPFRAKQLYNWIYNKKFRQFDAMTNLSPKFIEKLKEKVEFTTHEVANSRSSQDGCRKLLIKLEDGEFVECLMLKDRDHFSACISSQVGCRMGCAFCSTATLGLKRHLTTGEILAQITTIENIVETEFHSTLTNLVFMGMGEPLDNVDNVAKAIDILIDENGFNYARKKITVSTCGVIEKLHRLTELKYVPNIAISLNAPDDEIRSRIMPVNKAHPISDILSTLSKLYALPRMHREKVTIEYIMIKGVNDSIEQSKQLAKLLANTPCKINLIRYNQNSNVKQDESDPFTPSSLEQTLAFQAVLIDRGFDTFIRKSLGSDIAGACGQLALTQYDK